MLIVSVNVGGGDTMKPAPKVAGVRTVLYTDRLVEAKQAGWEAIKRVNSELSAAYLVKAPKCAPHLLGHEDEEVLWLDATMTWTGRSLRELFDQVPRGGVGCFRHRIRRNLTDEATACSKIHVCRAQPVLEQARRYGTSAPGLHETGIVVWRGAQRTLGVRWLAEQLAWSNRDQISLPYVARVTKTTITALRPGDVIRNPWFAFTNHARKR